MFGFFKKQKAKPPWLQEGSAVETLSRETLQNAVAAFGRKDADLHTELGRVTAGSQVTAQQLYWFMPTALFHIMFPEVETADGNYTIVYPDQSKEVFLFANDPVYNAIYVYLKAVCPVLDKDTVYSILGHSSELDVVNQALNAREKAGLEPNLEGLLLSGPVYMLNE